LFGGIDGFKYLNDTWTFDGEHWTKIRVTGAPPARASAGAAYDSKLKQVVLFGGYNGQYLDDTWLWNGATSTWAEATPAHRPPGETGPMLFPDPLNGRADEFGGYDGRFFRLGTWRWGNGDWHMLPFKGSASGRAGAVVGTDPVAKQTVVSGGIGDIGSNNTWTFDGHVWTLQSPATQPNGLTFSATVYDPRFNGVVTFGGYNGAIVNDTWLWSANDWTQLSPEQAPPPRERMGMAFDELRQRTVVFGGVSNNGLLNDTWVLEITSN
jgi:Galactose oxidase, central domain